MDLTNVKTVAIIGAGVAGLSTAKQLLAEGLDCTVFERGEKLGGVWADGYSNFGVQVQKELYEFPDYPLPSDIPDFTPGVVIQRYLEYYAKHFGVWSHIHFKAPVTQIQKRSVDNTGWLICVNDNGTQRNQVFDLVVVCMGLYSNIPNIPKLPGRHHFKGEVFHNSEFKHREQLKDKKVVIVGLGKSATDSALEAATVAEETTIVFRKANWPLPAKIAGILPFKWVMLNRFTSALIPPYYRLSFIERIVHTLGKPLVWIWWRLVELLLIVQCRMWSCFGLRVSLIPKESVEYGAFSESSMLPRPEFYRSLRNRRINPQNSEIARYTSRGIALKNGKQIDADVVVFGTGWKPDYCFLPESLRAQLKFDKDGLYLYRQMIHPDVSNLIFIGQASTVINILTYNLQARWLCELIKGTHKLPAHDDMLHNIKEIKTWKRKRMPFSGARSARLIFHMQHYHDELLRDFGANPHLKKGVFWWFKEIFAPYQPSDYRTIVTGERDRKLNVLSVSKMGC